MSWCREWLVGTRFIEASISQPTPPHLGDWLFWIQTLLSSNSSNSNASAYPKASVICHMSSCMCCLPLTLPPVPKLNNPLLSCLYHTDLVACLHLCLPHASCVAKICLAHVKCLAHLSLSVVNLPFLVLLGLASMPRCATGVMLSANPCVLLSPRTSSPFMPFMCLGGLMCHPTCYLCF